jgi:hypothetical protein
MCETTAVLRRTLRERWGIALFAVCALALSACGGEDNSTTQAQTETQTTARTQTTGETETETKPQTEIETTASAGSANAVSAERYVSSVCSSVKTLRRQSELIAKEFKASIAAASSVADVRKSFVEYLDDAIALTDRVAGRVGRAGTPDVEGGAQVAADVRRSLREFRSFYMRLRGQLRELPVDDVAALNRRLQSIGSSLKRQNAALAKSFDTLSSRDAIPELRRTVTNSPACAGL